jgi:hypothetical protein
MCRYKDVIADKNFSKLSQEALSIFLAHHRKVQPLQGLLDAANAWCDSDQQRLDTALQVLTNQMHEMLPKQQERPQPAPPSAAASQQPVMQAQQSIHQAAMVPDNQTMQTQELHQRQQMMTLSKNSMVPQPGGGWAIPITSTAQVCTWEAPVFKLHLTNISISKLNMSLTHVRCHDHDALKNLVSSSFKTSSGVAMCCTGDAKLANTLATTELKSATAVHPTFRWASTSFAAHCCHDKPLCSTPTSRLCVLHH